MYSVRHPSGRMIQLIDTPGFNDTQRSDEDILKETVYSLTKFYAQNVLLSGIIYLHRITDPRMTGSATKNLEIFKRLCGKEAFPQVALVTTRWDEATSDEEAKTQAQERETQLVRSPNYWAPIVQCNARVMRYFGNAESAWRVVDSLISPNQRVPLAVQREMIDENLPLNETSVGKFVSEKYDELRRRYEQELREVKESAEEALKAKDEKELNNLLAQQKDYEAKQIGAVASQKGLAVSFLALEKQRRKEILARIQKLDSGGVAAGEGSDKVSGAQKGSETEQARRELQMLTAALANLTDDHERTQREQNEELKKMRRQQATMRAEEAEARRKLEYDIQQRERQQMEMVRVYNARLRQLEESEREYKREMSESSSRGPFAFFFDIFSTSSSYSDRRGGSHRRSRHASDDSRDEYYQHHHHHPQQQQ